ncbi:Cytochrome P450 [Macrophomina phaseolina MS6]|uniref:Cytochrome P450 n=1 Tax=Macrophomina phaseolina (strain MS6) TaxID=1126212 RepID=K2R3P3_MACPH|nr:Cytochrome P450 [Macrophomina phaseolina MS6]
MRLDGALRILVGLPHGPIVRIKPNEVHIRDPAYFEILFSNNQKIEKERWFYNIFPDPSSTFSTMPNDLYRLRRSAISKPFSANAIDRMEPLLHEKVKKLFSRLDGLRNTGEAVDIGVAFRALTMDIASAYVLPSSRDYLEQPDLGHAMQLSHRAETTLCNWRRHALWLVPLLRRLPGPLSPVEFREALGGNDFRNHWGRLAIEARNVMSTTRDHNDPGISVLEAVRTSPLLPEHERSFTRICSEASGLLGAGVDAPSSAMAGCVYYVCTTPSILAKLRAELKVLHTSNESNSNSSRKDSIHDTTTRTTSSPSSTPTLPDLVPYRILEKLPYLQSCIRESLRLHPPVLSRLPRTSPTATLTYTSPTTRATHSFPPRTTISMSLPDLHLDPSIFPDPHAFRPERWLDASPAERARMDKAFVPFSRGQRMCVGHELAKRELSVTLGNLFRVFEMEVEPGTGPEDLASARDFFGPLPERGRGRVGVRVKGLSL